MSMDRSLRSKSTLQRHRNVLTRAERIGVMKEDGRWNDGDRVTGLVKVAHRKASVGKKSKAEKKAAEGAAAEAAAAAPAAAPAPAAKEKSAKGAKGSKSAKG